MKFKAVLHIAVAGLLLNAGIASAETIKYQFKGVVTYGGNMALVGSPIQGTFSLDTKTPASAPKIKGYEYASYQMPADLSISAQVGPHSVEARNLTVTVFNDMGANTEDMVEVYGASPVLDGTIFPDGLFGFVLASGPGNTKVLHNTHLPKEFDVSRYDAQPTPTPGVLQSNGYEGGMLLEFSVESIERIEAKK